MFDLDKEISKIKKLHEKIEKERLEKEIKFTRSSLDDALSAGILKLALDINKRTKKEEE